jgi:aryl-alcohol dehydrogenase-like predicted oxidoreductase
MLTIPPLVVGTVHPDPALWERYVECGAGGPPAFDTARHYGDASEGALGAFLERNDLRGRALLIGKGAHTPDCAPEHVAPQLTRSLELLRTDHVDLYLLHRDDPSVPVGAWVEALEAELEAGRVRAIGASNWTAERYEAFDAEAARAGATPFSILSNQLSLAEMREPVWAGCLRADTRWHERTGVPLLAWSAQARGYFSDRARDAEIERCWGSRANAGRRARARWLAGELGVPPVSVAIAWLLARPFATHALVGPTSPAELDACLAGTRLTLSEDRLRWLARG